MHPDRVFRIAAVGTDKYVIVTVLNAHQGDFANGPRLIAFVGDNDARQAGISQCGALGTAAAFMEFDLFAHPVECGGNVLIHE